MTLTNIDGSLVYVNARNLCCVAKGRTEVTNPDFTEEDGAAFKAFVDDQKRMQQAGGAAQAMRPARNPTVSKDCLVLVFSGVAPLPVADTEENRLMIQFATTDRSERWESWFQGFGKDAKVLVTDNVTGKTEEFKREGA